jgi:8-oxo-dGTP diphosphatase
LLRYVPADGGDERFFLEQRSRSVDEGGSWGIPGGAIRAGETPEVAARREMKEEVGSVPPYRKTSIATQDCGGGWQFYVVSGDVDEMFIGYSVHETDATGWFTRSEMQSLPLHPGTNSFFQNVAQDGSARRKTR